MALKASVGRRPFFTGRRQGGVQILDAPPSLAGEGPVNGFILDLSRFRDLDW